MTSSSSNLNGRANRTSDATIGSRIPHISTACVSEYRVAHRWWTSYISTAISPSGNWLICASRDEIRLFNIGTTGQELDAYQTISSPSLPEKEKIQVVAISQSLVAILTTGSLVVCELSTGGKVAIDSPIYKESITLGGTWIPHSLTIFERKWTNSNDRSSGWVAVGGQGETAVKIFSLSWSSNAWTLYPPAVTLRCTINMGSIQLVAFSPSLWDDPGHPFVFGVNSSNVIYCWDLRGLDRKRGVDISWHLGGTSASGDPVSHHEDKPRFLANMSKIDRGRITSVVPLFSSSESLYVFVTADQVPGSEICSFIERVGPLKCDSHLWEPCRYSIPEDSIGRSALLGTVSPDGLYGVVVEKDAMRVLVLKGVKGGLACFKKTEKWRSQLRETAKNISGLSVSVLHEAGQLKIVAADGRGRILKADVRAPTSIHPKRISGSPSAFNELPGRPFIPELSGESSGQSGSASSRSRISTQFHETPG